MLFNNKQSLNRFLKSSESGQVLLIGILLATILLTIGLSLIDLTAKDTRISKLQEDTSRARAAAEAGIEAALNDVNATHLDLSEILAGQNITGSVDITTDTSSTFTTPLISKDAQYTFYLTGYDRITKTISATSMDSDLTINRIYPSDSGYCGGSQAFAVELTFISTTSGISQRYLIDECALVDDTVDEYAFGAQLPTASLSPDPQIMIARVIAPSNSFNGAKLQIVNNTGGNQWPAQGLTVTSTATIGGSNVTKTVRLFQSFPQLPAEFSVTEM